MVVVGHDHQPAASGSAPGRWATRLIPGGLPAERMAEGGGAEGPEADLGEAGLEVAGAPPRRPRCRCGDRPAPATPARRDPRAGARDRSGRSGPRSAMLVFPVAKEPIHDPHRTYLQLFGRSGRAAPPRARRGAASSWWRCPASACRSSRSATVRRCSRRSASAPRPTSGSSPACPTATRCSSSRAAPRLQFSMVPMNLLPAGGTADYLVTGVWSEKAIKEAKKLGKVHVAATTKATNHDRIPGAARDRLRPSAAYVHMTSNNTIYGTQWHDVPQVPAGVPLVTDTSSDIFCRPIDVSKFGADLRRRAEEPVGPPGVTWSIVRDDLLARAPDEPARLCSSTRSTPRSARSTTRRRCSGSTSCAWCCAGCSTTAACRRWRSATGARPTSSTRRSTARGGYYRGHAPRRTAARWMNVTFRLPSEELEKAFVAEATKRGPQRPQGPPFGRRHPRLDLQRLPRGRRRRPGRLHGRLPAPQRLKRPPSPLPRPATGGPG